MKYTALCPSCFNRFNWTHSKGLTKHKCFSDGPAMVSTGVDNRDGNTVGDDRKSSKTK